MKISVSKTIWLCASILAALSCGAAAFLHPLRFASLSDLLATVISIMIGISLAISAILSSRPQLSSDHYKTQEERHRIEGIIKRDYAALNAGQYILFWCYYISLLLAILLKFLNIYDVSTDVEVNVSMTFKIISSAFAFASCFALLWSATLPSLLRKINIQRTEIE